jgi:hypothetical protein
MTLGGSTPPSTFGKPLAPHASTAPQPLSCLNGRGRRRRLLMSGKLGVGTETLKAQVWFW